ncbi:MAG TPA: phosphate-starvation-inducible PsiE family protein [Candidatus Hydrogenedens sp.]|nr:phosphate-starvation-inducible PsiE family protein [Candidatus Hydrogenedens sp.]HOK08323.1 phosphate-starvation-inducible PsiE family protein [Candidatus Hydrogenedens sp.]HOL18883.1 phosphate-starvation-inducible PsiE family protein [Candidatus Hydrogenedens sp.]HPP57617.1 phosphate-starvation-inducible PsiE family protein [Candidatus Hydrogenedens sp.]
MENKTSNFDKKVINFSQECLRWVIRFLTLIMVFVIAYSAIDIVSVVMSKIWNVPKFLLTVDDLVDIFGAFLGVLIAIEIYENIVLYLREDAIHVKTVVATALIAVSRKVIIMDFNKVEPFNVLALGVLVIAVAVAYWFVKIDQVVFKKEK